MSKQQKERGLEVLRLINQNHNWEDVLSSPPYNLIIKKKHPFVLLKYNQIESDMANKIVQECRGLILKEVGVNKYDVASMRFTKFFNYGQKEAAKLEFPCEASEKIDGSLISLFYDKDSGWHVSTSGNIDAEDAPIGAGGFNNYREVFDVAWGDLSFELLNKDFTYIFELVSPYTRVIVPYKDTKLYLLAIRNNKTLKEISRDNVTLFDTPKSFVCNSIQEIQSATEKLSENDVHYEGFVLCDKNFNRVKLKSSAYTNLFFMKGDGIFSDKKILTLIIEEQDDDILGHFPEYKDDFDRIRRGLSLFITRLKTMLKDGQKQSAKSKKDFALCVKDYKYKDILFKAYGCGYWNKDGEFKTEFLKQYVKNIPISKLVDFVREENEG